MVIVDHGASIGQAANLWRAQPPFEMYSEHSGQIPEQVLSFDCLICLTQMVSGILAGGEQFMFRLSPLVIYTLNMPVAV